MKILKEILFELEYKRDYPNSMLGYAIYDYCCSVVSQMIKMFCDHEYKFYYKNTVKCKNCGKVKHNKEWRCKK